MLRSVWRLILSIVLLAIPQTLLSQPAFLIEDVYEDVSTGPPRSNPPTQEFTPLGTTLFFVRDDGLHGFELWKSDGTEAGTGLLIDLCPGSCSSTPRSLTVSNGVLFFIADDGARGFELWKSDGTAAGTALVRDIYPEPGNPFPMGSPGGLLDVNGTVYFAANDGIHGQELWMSDGTAAGTVLVKDVNPGPESSHPRPWARDGGTLLFNADDGMHGREPWVSTGTSAGTAMVKDVHPGSASSSADVFPLAAGRDALALPGGAFVFRADDGTHGPELWRTDGTEAGTVLIKDVHPAAGSAPSSLAALGSAIYFAASDGTNGRELWKTDGTGAGTVLVKDISSGSSDSLPMSITASGSRIFFRAFDEDHGMELWLSDGTAAGTVLVSDTSPGQFGGLGISNGFTPFGSGVLFFATLQLWRSDGTEAGTVQITELGFFNQPLSSLYPGVTWAAAGDTYFFATQGVNDLEDEANFWASDGTAAGTLPIWLSHFPVSSIVPNLEFLRGKPSFAEHNGRFLFPVHNFGSADRLRTSNATADGTIELTGAQFGTPQIRELTPVPGGPVFFDFGWLYKTDATPAGTVVNSPTLAVDGDMTAVGSSVFFSCTDASTFNEDFELCRSDGTPAGTGRIEDLRPGSEGSFPSQLTVSGSTLFFKADDGTSGSELFKSDGTAPGTGLIRDVWLGGDSSPDRLTDVDGTLFFSAFTPGAGRELWKSDGTEAGTILVKDIRPGADASIEAAAHWVGFTAVAGETLLFVANDGVHGAELWKSDGTEAGTALVKDIATGSLGSSPFWLTRVGNRVYFSADDRVHGRELWVSDGTAAGTRMVADLRPGEDSSLPGFLRAVGHIVVFSATDGVHGVEMWRSNGTIAGTRMIQDIAPGPLSANPVYFTPSQPYIFFAANDNTTGMEPWAVPRSNVLATFSDVPTDFWAWPYVEALAGAGLTGGCLPGLYCPGANVSRAETAVFLLRGIHGLDFVPSPATGTVFQDVPAGYWAAPWIERFAADGFTSGCSLAPPLFCPAQPLNRDQMAVFLLKAKHGSSYTPPPATGTVFSDVPASYWAAPWIERLAAEGITAGCAPGVYCPGDSVTRAQMAVFLTRTFNLPLP